MVNAEPIRIDTVTTLRGGVIAMLHCPGRCGGAYGARDLDVDLAAVEASGAAILLTLNEANEFARLGVPALAQRAACHAFQWLHAPIPDFATPGPAFAAAWTTAGPLIAAALDARATVAIHCAAGLGRTGTLAAILLRDHGADADEAIAQVRAARPGTIETAAQAEFVRTAPRLLPDATA